MKNKIYFLTICLIGLLFLTGCGLGSQGVVRLNITDAPLDAANIDEVVITVEEIHFNSGEEDTEGGWTVASEFEGPQSYDLLDLTGGIAEMMGEFTLPAGHISQIRFILSAPETGDSAPTNPGSYVQLTGETDHLPLFVPSGSNTGIKFTGGFDVPLNGSIEVTADFDVRKSLKLTGQNYNLRPTIRTIVNGEAGDIEGSFTYTGTASTVLLFAYEDETWDASEADSSLFDGAITNAVIDLTATTPSYVLAYLAAGTYDLVAAEFDANGDVVTASVAVVQEDAVVTSGEDTTANINF